MATSSRMSHSSLMAASMLLLGLLFIQDFQITGVESVGVCYGMQGNNLPSPPQVISLYQSNNINSMRIYNPDQPTLQALRGSNIQLILGVPNSDLQSLSDPSTALSWVQNNVFNFPDVSFRYIAVGNEVDPANGDPSQFVLSAMQNIYNAISSAGLQGQIGVSTAIAFSLLGQSFPPSQGSFRGDVTQYIDPIIGFLVQTNSPLLANIYPYFSYSGDPTDISLEYASFTSPSVVVTDGPYEYQNLFDAMLDALYVAIEGAGGGSLGVVVSESGWPSDGGFAATLDNEFTYNSNLIQHVNGGTPRRPNGPIETYLFAMFDENNKSPELEKHFGQFYPDGQPKFQLNFGAGRAWDVYAQNNTSVYRESISSV
ncbi:unnamed protein product [Camellia sinensis]